ncbi:AMP-binding protein [Pseudomonas vlassakiae]|jgi:long-subunit acyl-CoA synthetase (AMP-forming)|uniref:AMP-binding protein n=1 Tax=Pseudomonas TaxID=286 RepID=UPI000C1A5A24|nr:MULTISPECIES: AMP-binding protein [unclassified Pseudomonas]MBS3185579.1 AMP-binding protein [Pseudomonas sp. PCH44]PIK80462.1 long-chain acyl-CoA synthetase [Pseudomonas sp. 382]
MPHELERFRQLLLDLGRERGDALAVEGDTERFTYKQVLAEVWLRAKALSAHPPGVLALALDNGPELLFWDLAALVSERACVIVPTFFSKAQVHHCIEQCGASLVLCQPVWEGVFSQLGFVQQESFWTRDLAAPVVLPAGTAKVTYTSGSTGTPKGVCLGADAMLRVAHELELASRPTEPQRYLAVLPLGVLLENLGVYAALMAGARVLLYPQAQLGMGGASQVDFKRLLGAIALSGAQSLILVPQLLMGLVTAIERGLMKVGPLRFVAVGGARVSPGLLARAEAIGLPVFEGYGLSECASVVALNRPGAMRRGSVGRPLPHVQVRIAEDGEVLVSGSVLLGYLGEAPASSAWWATGDLGYFDDDGYLYLDGRKKHQFITSFGRNVNPEWVEAELTQSGVIAQAFVHGEGLPRNLALLWPLDPGASDEAIEQAVQRSNATLPDYARVHAWRRLPGPLTAGENTLTANGRPRREAILQRYHTLLSDIQL